MSNTDIIAQNMRPIKQVGEHIGDVLVVSNIADEITTVSTDRNAILAVYHNLATVSTSEKYAEESKAAADKSREYARLAMAVAQGGSGTWLEGPPGIQGEKGDQGEPGQKGDQGETGSKGATGDRGPQGLQGVPGVAGSLGAQGLQGVPGVQGLQGLPGPQGNAGPAGENAAAAINPRGDFQVNATPLYAKNDYITASNGNSYVCKLGMTEANIAPTTGDSADPHWQILALAGAQGLQGIQGEIGAKGDKGDKGETGEKGDKGETGAQGFDGAQGTAGATGAQGLQGMQGEQGLKGDKGEAGAGIPLGGAVGQVIVKKSSNDLDVMWGEVSGEGGTSSGTTDHSALTNRDKIDQHPISAVTGLQAVLDNLDSEPNTWEDLQGKPTAFTPETHATSHAVGGDDSVFPSVVGNAGKFLSNDGARLSWSDTVVSGVTTIYVSKSGNDTNSGTESSPFLTIGRATNELRKLNCTSGSIQIYIGEGIYDEVVAISYMNVPVGIKGSDSGTPTTISSMLISHSKLVSIEDLIFEKAGATTNMLSVTGFSVCRIINRGITLRGAGGNRFGLVATNYSMITINTIYFTGSFQYVIYMDMYSHIYCSGGDNTVTFNNVSSSVATLSAIGKSIIYIFQLLTVQGTNTGVRYTANTGAIISTGTRGPNAIPGSIAGTVAGGAQYL